MINLFQTQKTSSNSHEIPSNKTAAAEEAPQHIQTNK